MAAPVLEKERRGGWRVTCRAFCWSVIRALKRRPGQGPAFALTLRLDRPAYFISCRPGLHVRRTAVCDEIVHTVLSNSRWAGAMLWYRFFSSIGIAIAACARPQRVCEIVPQPPYVIMPDTAPQGVLRGVIAALPD